MFPPPVRPPLPHPACEVSTMNTVLSQFLIEVPTATVIWSALLVLALAGIAILVARPERDRPGRCHRRRAGIRRPTPGRRPAPLRRGGGRRRPPGPPRRPAVTARPGWRPTTPWNGPGRRTTRRSRCPPVRWAGRCPPRSTPHTPAEYQRRERWLHRAAVAAYWRGELTMARLRRRVRAPARWDPVDTRSNRRC